MNHSFYEGELEIDTDDWFDFLFQRTPLPKSMGDGGVVYGPPSPGDEGRVIVPFAVNTICHPSEQADPPSFMKKKGS